MRSGGRSFRLGLILIAALLATGGPATSQVRTATFAEQIAALSEPGGYFDTDNLISNERSYLTVLPALAAAGVRGGAYVGVGPDQNFSYIAAIRPSMAVIIDIRRDNLLLHLLFKALFAESRTRVDYLAQLCGRPIPADATPWRTRPIEELVRYVDQTAATPRGVTPIRERVMARIREFGVPLTPADLATIDRFHRRFIQDGLGLQFNSTGRAPQWSYPTLRDLVLETDGEGRQASFLASEEGFAFLKSLQARDLIVPVVGDLSGPTALRAIGRFVAARNERVSALYASNVEFYLDRNRTFPQFVANVRHLPWSPRGVIIRSVFGGGSSESSLEPIVRFLNEN
jgi:hypothetical protein